MRGGWKLAIAAAVIAVAVPLAAVQASRSTPSLELRTVRGPNISLGPFDVSSLNEYNVSCPVGYYATGHGVGLGALDLVYATPSPDGRAYQFAFANTSAEGTYSGFGHVRCARGAINLRVTSRASQTEQAKAIAEAKARLREEAR